MRNRLLIPVSGIALAAAVALWAPRPVEAQAPAQPAQAPAQQPSRAEIREKARQTSYVSEEEAAKVWEAEYKEAVALAAKRVYDPNRPLATNIKRTPWGDPDLSGYYLTATYTPLQRPKEVTKPLYTIEESTPTSPPTPRSCTTTGRSSAWKRGRVRFDRTCARA
jgi:hypothetical protein